MKEKKSIKAAARAKTVLEEKPAEPIAEKSVEPIAEKSVEPIVEKSAELVVEKPVTAAVPKRNWTKAALIAGLSCALVALVADDVCLHVEVRRQTQALQEQSKQIAALNAWIEHASVQGKWNDGKQSVKGFGHRLAEKFRAAGRKTVDAFHKADDTLNPQSDK